MLNNKNSVIADAGRGLGVAIEKILYSKGRICCSVPGKKGALEAAKQELKFDVKHPEQYILICVADVSLPG